MLCFGEEQPALCHGPGQMRQPAKDQRGQGVATLLMQYLLPQIHPQGCYCFALPHLEQFYLRLGFSLQPKHCPADIQQKYEQYRARGRDWLLMGYITETACPIS